jgi:hypothetical protein
MSLKEGGAANAVIIIFLVTTPNCYAMKLEPIRKNPPAVIRYSA